MKHFLQGLLVIATFPVMVLILTLGWAWGFISAIFIDAAQAGRNYGHRL